MTAATRTEQFNRPNHTLLIILCLVLFALAGVVAVKAAANNHAEARHGADARAIWDCLDRNGPAQTWESLSPFDKRFYQTCELPDGRWGFRVIEQTARGWKERTSFVPGPEQRGSLFDLMNYLKAKARIVAGLPGG